MGLHAARARMPVRTQASDWGRLPNGRLVALDGRLASRADLGLGQSAMAEEIARRPTRSTVKKTETDRERIAEQLADALREAGYECLIVLPSSH